MKKFNPRKKQQDTKVNPEDQLPEREQQKPYQESKKVRPAAFNPAATPVLPAETIDESKRGYRFLFDHIDQGVQICDLVRNREHVATGLDLLHVNPAWVSITGVTAEKIREKKGIELLPELDRPWFKYCEQVINDGKPARFETKMNKNRWLDLVVTRMEGDRFMLLLTDITDRKRQEANQSFMAHCSASLLKVDVIGDILKEIGKNAYTCFGAVACVFFVVDTKKDQVSKRAEWLKVSRPFSGHQQQFSTAITKTGRNRLLRSMPLLLNDGDLLPSVPGDPVLDAMQSLLYIPIVRNRELRYLLSIYHTGSYEWFSDQVLLLSELADRIWNKLATLEAENKLSNSEAHYKAIINQTVSGIFKLTLTGQITFANDYFVKMLGYSHNELLQMTVKDIVHKEDLEKTFDAFSNMISTRQPFEIEKRLLRKDGSVLWVTNYVAPVFDREQEPIEAIVTSVDISRQKAVERQKDEFISIASHELKTPLTSVKAYGQLVRQASREEDPVNLTNMIDKMNVQIDRLVNLVGTILDASRLAQQEFSISLQKLDMNELIREKVKENQLAAPHFNIVFNACDDAWIYGDKLSLGQVVSNLISNAVKYSTPGSKVTINSRHSGKAIRVSVADEGIGISEKDQEKIFEKYYRSVGLLESGRSGIGLGLYLCHEIMRRHNGRIGVTSALGKGTTFYFTIPSLTQNQL